MALLRITRWPTLFVFVLAGGAAALFAFVTVNLFGQAMANRDFIREFGWVAIENGALWQIAELTLWGAMALICWIVFKVCEQEISARYIGWARKGQEEDGRKVRSKRSVR